MLVARRGAVSGRVWPLPGARFELTKIFEFRFDLVTGPSDERSCNNVPTSYVDNRELGEYLGCLIGRNRFCNGILQMDLLLSLAPVCHVLKPAANSHWIGESGSATTWWLPFHSLHYENRHIPLFPLGIAL